MCYTVSTQTTIICNYKERQTVRIVLYPLFEVHLLLQSISLPIIILYKNLLNENETGRRGVIHNDTASRKSPNDENLINYRLSYGLQKPKIVSNKRT